MKITIISADNFVEEVLQADKPVLVDFYADWCGPCQMLMPTVKEIAEERDDIIDYSRPYLRTTVVIFKNVQALRKQGEQYAIVFKNGLSHSPYENPAEQTTDETIYILIDHALKELSNDRSIMNLIEKYLAKAAGKECVVIGRSNIVGKPMALLLLAENGTVTVCHSKKNP